MGHGLQTSLVDWRPLPSRHGGWHRVFAASRKSGQLGNEEIVVSCVAECCDILNIKSHNQTPSPGASKMARYFRVCVLLYRLALGPRLHIQLYQMVFTYIVMV